MSDLHIADERERFIVSRWAYSVGAPIMPDSEYTILLDYMKSKFPEDEYVNRSWSSDPCPVKLLTKYNLQHLIDSIIITDKTESIPSLNSWDEVTKELGAFNGQGSLSMKHDGWNMQFFYYNGHFVKAQSRGRSCTAMNMNMLQERVPYIIPWMGSVRVVGEVTVSHDNFEFCRYTFHNADERSAVHTLLSKPEYQSLLDIHMFDIHGVQLAGQCKFKLLESAGFTVPKYYNVSDFDDIQNAMGALSGMAGSYSSPTDGMVFDGPFSRAIRLLAWEEPVILSYVQGYLESYKIHYISPELRIRPVIRKGGIQRKIAITNWQRIIDNNLRPGYPVAFRLASSATADFDAETTRLLQKEYEGRYEAYRAKIDEEERLKEWRLNTSRVV